MLRRTVIALGSVLAALVGAAVLRYRSTREVVPYDLVDRTVGENAAEGRPLGLEPVQVGASRALVRPPSSGQGWLLFWGGAAGHYFREAVQVVGGLGLPPEVGVLIVAPPGFDSPGRPSPAQVGPQAASARDWLRATHGAQRIVAAGFSLGSFWAAAAAERDVAGLLLMGPTPRLLANVPGPALRFTAPDVYLFAERPPRVPGLVLKGELDEPWVEGQQVARWLGAPLVTLEGTTHEASVGHPLARREAAAFIATHLKAP